MKRNTRPTFNPCILTAALALTFAGAGCKESPAPSAPPFEPKASATPTQSPTPSGPTDARVVPVSGGDAIVEAFWDRNLEAWPKWKIASQTPKAEATRQWSMMTVKWKADAAGEGPTIERSYVGEGVLLAPYSQLVLSAGLPKGSKVTLNAETDAGPVTKEFVCEVGHTDQFVLPLPGAKSLYKVGITFGAAAPGSVLTESLGE